MTISFDDLDDALTSSRKATGVNLNRVSIVNGGETGYEQITCPKCGGRGSKTYGYVNITTYPCHMCKQTGKVTARRIAAVAAAKKGRETAEENRRIAYRDWCQTKVGEYCLKTQEWNSFAASMIQSAQQYGRLTENQNAAIERMIAKAEARKAEKSAAQASAPTVDVSVIEKLFAQAAASKLKRPVFRALDGIAVSKAPEHGRNAGALYVKEGETYAGKIVGGKFLATREASAAVLPRLLAVAADPLGQAVLYGKQTGNCCCCGRELTNKVSVELGIGPICRGAWGI